MSKRIRFLLRIALLSSVVLGIALSGSAQITSSPASVDFGEIGIGLRTTREIDLTNTGTKNVTVESWTFSSPVFGLADGLFPRTLNPGTTDKWSVAVIPAVAGTVSGTLTINYSSGSLTVPLTVIGELNTGVPTLSTTSVNFGSVPLGATVNQTVTVTNSGTEAFNVTEVNAYNPYFDSGYSNIVTLNPAQSLSVTVSCSPMVVGTVTGFLNFTYDFLPSSGVDLTCTGVAPSGLAITNYPQFPGAVQGFLYQAVLQASGGKAPYSYSILSGSVPGLTLSSSTGTLSGTVSSTATIGNDVLTVQVKDSSSPPLSASSSVTIPVAAPAGANCNIIDIDVTGTSTLTTALNDLGTATYQGYEGGLYPNGSNTDPSNHVSDGVSIGDTIQPLDSDGNPDPNGVYVLLALGQSTTQQPFWAFVNAAVADPAKNPKLVIINGGLGGATANLLDSSSSGYMTTVVDYILPYFGVTPQQVVAAWINAEDSSTGLAFPGNATTLQGQLETLAQYAKTTFPNLVLSYWGSLNYTGYSLDVSTVDTEPQGYESGFAVKWAIGDQLNGNANLNYNPTLGPVVAPWMSWGPYYWANGLVLNHDGTYWSCGDVHDDGLHPTYPGGHLKITQGLLNQFKTDPTAAPWFLAPSLSVAPSSLSFGSYSIGTSSSPQNVTATNVSTSTLAIGSITIAGTDPTDFSQTNTCGSSLAAGATCTISVTFTPTASGTRTANVSVSDSGSSVPVTVALTGTGVAPGATLSPTSVSFGTLLTGSTATPQTVTLTNSGAGTLTITSITITGTNSAKFGQTNNCGASLAASASCTITVTISTATAGSFNATLSVADNAAGSPQTASLGGTVRFSYITITPASLNFGTEKVGSASAAQTLTVANIGTTLVTFTRITTTGADPKDFPVSSNTCSGSLAAGASCVISIRFKPTATGSRTATENIYDNSGVSPQTATLKGTGD